MMKSFVILMILAIGGQSAALFVFDSNHVLLERGLDFLHDTGGDDDDDDNDNNSLLPLPGSDNGQFPDKLQAHVVRTLADDSAILLAARTPPGTPKSPKSPKSQQDSQQPDTSSNTPAPDKDHPNVPKGWVVLRHPPRSAKKTPPPSQTYVHVQPPPSKKIADSRAISPFRGKLAEIDMHAFDGQAMKDKEKKRRTVGIGNPIPTPPKTLRAPHHPESEDDVYFSPMNSPPGSPLKYSRRDLQEASNKSHLARRGICASLAGCAGHSSKSQGANKEVHRSGTSLASTGLPVTRLGSAVSESPFARVDENMSGSSNQASSNPSATSSPAGSPRNYLSTIQETRGRQQSPSGTGQTSDATKSLRAGYISDATSPAPRAGAPSSDGSIASRIAEPRGGSPKRPLSEISESPSAALKKFTIDGNPDSATTSEVRQNAGLRSARKIAAGDSPSRAVAKLHASDLPVVPPSRWSNPTSPAGSSQGVTTMNLATTSTKKFRDTGPVVPPSPWGRTESRSNLPSRLLGERHGSKTFKELSVAREPIVPPSRWSQSMDHQSSTRNPLLSELPQRVSKSVSVAQKPVVPRSRWGQREDQAAQSPKLSAGGPSVVSPTTSNKTPYSASSLVIPPFRSRPPKDKSPSSEGEYVDASSLTPSPSGKSISPNDSSPNSGPQWSELKGDSPSPLTKRGNCSGKSSLLGSFPNASKTSKISSKRDEKPKNRADVGGLAAKITAGLEISRPLRSITAHPSYGSLSETNSLRVNAGDSSESSHTGLLTPMHSSSMTSQTQAELQDLDTRSELLLSQDQPLFRRGACLGKGCSKKSQQTNQEHQPSSSTPSLRSAAGGRISAERVHAGSQSSEPDPAVSQQHSPTSQVQRSPPELSRSTPGSSRFSEELASPTNTPVASPRSQPSTSASRSRPVSAEAIAGSTDSSGASSARQKSDSPARQRSFGEIRLPFPERIPVRPLSASTEAKSDRIMAWSGASRRASQTGSVAETRWASHTGSITQSRRVSHTGSIGAESLPDSNPGPSVSQRASGTGDMTSRSQSASSVQPLPPWRLLGARASGSGSGELGTPRPSFNRLYSRAIDLDDHSAAGKRNGKRNSEISHATKKSTAIQCQDTDASSGLSRRGVCASKSGKTKVRPAPAKHVRLSMDHIYPEKRTEPSIEMSERGRKILERRPTPRALRIPLSSEAQTPTDSPISSRTTSHHQTDSSFRDSGPSKPASEIQPELLTSDDLSDKHHGGSPSASSQASQYSMRPPGVPRGNKYTGEPQPIHYRWEFGKRDIPDNPA